MIRPVELLDVSNLTSTYQVTKITAIAETSAKEITSIVATDATLLDGTYFVLQDEVGSVAFWIDVDNSGTSAPTHGADRAVEITTISTGMTAAQVGTAVYTAVVADSKFEAGTDDLSGNLTIQSTTYGVKTPSADGDTGFTISTDTAGSSGLDGTYFVLQDADGSVAFWIDVDNSGTSAPTHGADRAVEITTISTGDTANTIAGLLETAIHADSKFTASSALSVCTVTNVDLGDMIDSADGDTGFSFSITSDGYTQPDVYSSPQDIRGSNGYSAQITWASTTCAGTIKMQESNDGTTWIDAPSSTGSQAILNNSGTSMLNLSDRQSAWCRAYIDYTSGTLTSAEVIFNAK